MSKLPMLQRFTGWSSDNIANVLVPFHVITGYDHTSGFYGRGKKSIFEKFQKRQEVQHLLQKVGECLKLSDDASDDMRWFLLLKIYGGKETKCTEAKTAIWRKMKKKSFVCLPPDETTLYHHLDRVFFKGRNFREEKVSRGKKFANFRDKL